MKEFTRRSKIFLVWVFAWAWFIGAPLSILTLTACSSGCKSTAKSTYVVSGVTHVAAVNGLRGWNEYIGRAYADAAANTDTNKAAQARGKILEQEVQVKAAWEKYQAAQLTALTAAQEFSKIPPKDPNAPAAQDRLAAAMAASAATLVDVVALLEKFGIKIK